jgi:two-component system, sensor histidine kinase
MPAIPLGAPAPELRFALTSLVDVVPTNITLVDQSVSSSKLLADQIETLYQADRRKDEFLAILSHELRSPLAAIQNAVTVLRRYRGSDLTVQDGMHELIERQVRQLSLLAAGLTDVGRIKRGQLLLQHARIDLVTVLNNAIETMEPEVTRRSQVFTAVWPHSSVWVLADAGRLEQVFINRLTNASKYTDAGGQISMSLQAQDGFAVVRVKDSGIGIAALTLPSVFDLFMQVDVAAGRSKSGVGVGLALVRKIVEMHEGTVTAFSAGLGKGSEFVVRLCTQI